VGKRAAAIGVAGVLCCIIGGASALAATVSGSPKAGTIHVFVNPGNGQGNGQMLITGAIGDFGTTHKSTQGGKVYSDATLREGTIVFDLTALNAKSNSVNPPVNKRTCSASFSVTAPVPIVKGTGLYANISGTIKITESFGFLASRFTSGPNKGKCNFSNSAQPLAQMGSVHGSGTVSF
jgi:hypothetical protein